MEMNNMKHVTKKLFLLGYLTVATVVQAEHKITVFPEKTKQVISGIGFEIQCDSIGSGNNGLPEERLAVPHDLVQSERDRLADEMLKGFRYCRLAGGLYWRGLDLEKKYLQPRWPEQLEELRDMIDRAGVEGLSFEYWSPAPFWKTGKTYTLKDGGLRCFDEDFKDDPEYKGDVQRFLKDFAHAVVTDIKTLRAAGIKTSMWGLQNEPHIGHGKYSTCKYKSSDDYVVTYKTVASAIRKYDPSVMLFADTMGSFPSYIAPAMKRPEVSSLVDAYAVHVVGKPSSTVAGIHKNITEKLPKRPWFQNEYEYLRGGATPERCLNTAQHIMNSFQIGENPTWFWLHALKPFKNSEASGYSLGFWKSRLNPKKGSDDSIVKRRWVDGPAFTYIPDELKDAEFVNVIRPKGDKERGLGFNLVFTGDHDVYMVSSHELNPVPEGYAKTDLYTEYGDGKRDVIYKSVKPFNGKKTFPVASTAVEGKYAPPHALFVKASTAQNKSNVQPGINTPSTIHSIAVKSAEIQNNMKPGHWIYNDFNWNAVGSFVKRMPWDSKAVAIEDHDFTTEAKVFCFKRPNGKLTVVLSNASGSMHVFKVSTGLKDAGWKGYRYTPYERGENTMGVNVGSQTGADLTVTLPSLSWEFWEQQ